MDDTTRLQLSLNGVSRGRKLGFRLAQQKAARLVLDEVKDTEMSLRLYRLIMDMVDGV